MFSYIANKVFGTANSRIIKSFKPIIDKINSLEEEIKKLNDKELKNKTESFKKQLADGCNLDDLLPEVFAVVREASVRTLGKRHFDVQLMGGIVLHKGRVSEMKTGEGKTLAATLPVYLNALTEKGVHIVTVNDYLAQRDSEWMGTIYKFLGMSVGCITNNTPDELRKEQYQADITYGTNNEFGFDYLRDNLKYSLEERAQRQLNYAIIDEVDSILIDESRTPLVISGPVDDNTNLYPQVDKIIPQLSEKDYELDEKSKNITLTDQGNKTVEELLKQNDLLKQEDSLYEVENMGLIHHVNQALRANKLFAKDVDYIIKDGKVMIIDEFTGRIMDGRRYSDGLHQALEAKEKLNIQNENQTIASVTFQNYFRLYNKLAGMTGTAMTEAAEFRDIYGLEVVEIPTHNPITRIDANDQIYINAQQKYKAIIEKVKEAYEKGQPLLIGTISIENSEYLSSLLRKNKIKHNVLNARHHDKEAQIISQAGRFKAVTIATNMAGRGTDIMLGGNTEMLLEEKIGQSKKIDIAKMTADIEKEVQENKAKVIEAGGLFVLGTERHESRRIDNQLRGRSGRQGDIGKTKFYLSLEDDLMRVFGSEKITGMLTKLGLKDDEVIEHPWISKSLEKAQHKVEAHNYEIRKTLLKFDDVINEQRKIIYEQRVDIMGSEDLEDMIYEIADESNAKFVKTHIPPDSLPEEWDIEGLSREIYRMYSADIPIDEFIKKEDVTEEEIIQYLNEQTRQYFSDKVSKSRKDIMNSACRYVFLATLDQLWKDHLHTLDHLRTGINLRAYAQKDPLNEYKMEAYNLFKTLLDDFDTLALQRVMHIEISKEVPTLQKTSKTFETREDPTSKVTDLKTVTNRKIIAPEDRDPNDPETWGKISRNEPCPCGSSKKFKYCHGAIG